MTWRLIHAAAGDRRHRLSTAASLSALIVGSVGSVAGAQSAPAPAASVRPPQLQLVQPARGATLPSDRPTVFYRYAPGEPTDPLDDASFRLWIDGVDRSSGVRVGNGEAWGTLGSGRPLSPGAHLVIARVCSVRGICAAANDVVIAVPTAAVPPDDSSSAAQRRRMAGGKKHNHWKQQQTLIGDLVSNVVKLFRR